MVKSINFFEILLIFFVKFSLQFVLCFNKVQTLIILKKQLRFLFIKMFYIITKSLKIT